MVFSVVKKRLSAMKTTQQPYGQAPRSTYK